MEEKTIKICGYGERLMVGRLLLLMSNITLIRSSLSIITKLLKIYVLVFLQGVST